MDRVGIDDRPTCHAVASESVVVVDHVMFAVFPCGAVHHGVEVDTVALYPRLFRPEQLNGVTFTEVIRRVARLLLVWANDDMMVSRAVTVVNNRIFLIFDTVPFAAPFAGVVTAEFCSKSRMNRITQDDRVLIDVFLATESRIAVLQARHDEQAQIDGRVATASGRILVEVMTFAPDFLRVLTT